MDKVNMSKTKRLIEVNKSRSEFMAKEFNVAQSTVSKIKGTFEGILALLIDSLAEVIGYATAGTIAVKLLLEK